MNLILVTFCLLLVVELKTRWVHFASCTTSPPVPWMNQATCELTIMPGDEVGDPVGEVERLGGMLNYSYRKAA
jgi:hypothetical protein